MYEFWYDYVESKYGEKRRCVTWIEIYIVYQKQMIFPKILQKILKLQSWS